MKERVGKKYKTTQGETVEVIDYIDFHNCTVRFEDGTIRKNVSHTSVYRGKIKNLYRPSVAGVGYLGEGAYKAHKNNKKTKAVSDWRNMLYRCYDESFKNKFLTYKEASVCKEWHNFQNFAKWHEENFNEEFMQGWHLDKDILVKGNKIYSPQTCCFVPQEINALLVKADALRSEYPIGVREHKNKFSVRLYLYNKEVHIGLYDTVEEAFQAYKDVKESHIKEIASKYKDLISIEVYKALINYKVEITD